MAHAYSEDQLVEQPAITLLAELGWQTVSAMEEVFGPQGTLGRETKAEPVLVVRLRAALNRLNPSLPPEALSTAVDELTLDRSAMSLPAANREVYGLLKEGIPVSILDQKGGGQKTERVRVIDWENPAANDFLLVSQFSVTGALYTRRPDLVGFVNGLPIIVIELKKPGVPAQQAFDDNLTCYKSDIPQLFWFNGLTIASNGTESRVGSLTADWERFFEWKRIEREDEPRRVSLEVMLRGTCEPSRLLDLLENFTLFSEHKAGLVKVLGQNHQFLGVNNAIAATLVARKQGHGRGGVFWQTQGSGKSLAMVFFAQKILRKVPGNWTFVVVTDRVELDDQIAKTFKACGAVSESESDVCHAQSGAQLGQLLGENHRYVFTLIHKFQTPELLCDRPDVIVLTDESHRSQYDTLALNMRTALPRALFLAFTGTPLIVGEERTREVFGDYVSIYDFQQSVEDGATVPLFYENRTPELRLENPNLNEDIYNLIEAAELDEEQETRLERELGRQYQLITRDDRLETVAKDIVQHFLGRGFQGKAMVISIDKATALRMHDKVRTHWQAERVRVEQELAKLTTYGAKSDPNRISELRERLDVIQTTDMAVIVSSGQNEIDQMKQRGLDIAPHRKRMNDESLDEKFKDPTDPLRLVFVCAMWLTGFDAPSCSTVYLDKPMRNHTLMQTIARANRVFPGKHSGLIVDYANVFASLEQALAIYAIGQSGAHPVRDKQQLVETLRQAMTDAMAFCSSQGVHLVEIEQTTAGSLDRLTKIAEAVERLISPDPVRKDYLAQERWVHTLFQAVKPDPAVLEFSSRVACLTIIAETIRERTGMGPADISGVMADLTRILDESIAADGFVIAERTGSYGVIDLTKIDFAALAKRFGKSKTKNIELEQLKAAIRAHLEMLIRLNRTRTDYLAKFEDLIESYNAGSRNIEDLFKELLALSRDLNDEQQRHVRERLSEEELVIFDILTRPAPELSAEERGEVKKVARALLEKLRQLLVLNWRQKATARSQVKLAIEDVLDQGLPRAYTPELYKQKCSATFEHFYETYGDRGASVYMNAG
jgi:type I restriction enzyme R subunit